MCHDQYSDADRLTPARVVRRYVACEYLARGNVRGQYTKNVFKPIRKALSVAEEEEGG